MTGSCWLVADIGGTNARFALADPGARTFADQEVVPTSGAATLEVLVHQYLERKPGRRPVAACLAIAGPVTGDICSLTNAHIAFSTEQTRQRLDLDTLLVVNDFAAVARAVPELGPTDIVQIGGGRLDADPVALAIGPGTGLGVATLVRAGGGWHVVSGEGGHVGLSGLYDDDDLDLLRALRDVVGFPSAEMVLSGAGLTRLFTILTNRGGREVQAHEARPEWIVEQARAGTDERCVDAVNVFCRLLGATAADAALTTGATGGVFLAGGIVGGIADLLPGSGFREQFTSHPDMGHYLDAIGTAAVIAPQPGLLGALHLLLDEYERCEVSA